MTDEDFIFKLRDLCKDYDVEYEYWPENEFEGCAILHYICKKLGFDYKNYSYHKELQKLIDGKLEKQEKNNG